MFMKLDWGNVLKFADEREYYEVLGFLAKDEEYIRVYTESNDKSGAWAPQGRLLLNKRSCGNSGNRNEREDHR